MTDVLYSALRIGVGVYAGLCLLVFFRQSSYVYFPDRTVGLTPSYFNIPYEEVAFKTDDGETIAAWYIAASERDAPAAEESQSVDAAPEIPRKPVWTVLFCHGNAGDIGDRIDSVRTFHELGMHVLVFDYRGYGDSTGRPTEKGTYLDAQAAWDYLTTEKGVPAETIVLFGRSLGGSVAAWLAERVRAKALVVESAFTSAPDMASRMFAYLPTRWLCRFKYDTVSRIPRAGCPVLIAHSREDEMVPFSHGERLFAAARSPKKFVAMRGGHNAGGLDGDPDYQRALMAFLNAEGERAEN